MTIRTFEAHGTYTMGNPIDETFAVEGRKAKWKSHEEEGEVELSAPAFFVPLAQDPEVYGLLLGALLASQGTIALLPGGEAKLERTAEADVESAQGKKKRVVGYTITGLDLLPVRVWANEDGTYFGYVDAWYSCLEEGYEGAIPALVEIQKRLDAERDRSIADRLAHRAPEAGVAFVGAKVLDVEKKRWLPDQTVVVIGDRISLVGPSKSTKAPPGAEIVEVAGKSIIPGLWDMHAHLGPADGVLNVASGITTARDLGNNPDRVDDMKNRFDTLAAVGPHVLRSGFIEGRGENAAGAEITAVTEDEAKKAVEFYASRGYEGIKIYNSMAPPLVPVLAKLAHDRGMRVSGHVPAGMRAEDVVKAGYDEVQHVNMLFLNFLIDETVDTRTPQRFTVVADRASEVDLSSKRVQAFVKLLLEKKTVIDPTVNVFEWLFVARPGRVLPGVEPIAARLPVQLQRSFKQGGLPVDAEKDEKYVATFARVLAMVKMLHAKKVPIVAGTDSLAGLSLHRELELYVEAGIPAGDVLAIATIGSARVMKKDGEVGSIAKGKRADFVVIDGDPMARIQDLRKVVTTVRGGVSFSSPDLYEVVGVKRP
jgi:hypothetical protein